MKIGIFDWNIPQKENSMRFAWANQAGLKAIEFDLSNAENQTKQITDLSRHWDIQVPTLGVNACCSTSLCDPGQTNAIHDIFKKAVKTALELQVEKLQVPSFCESFIRTDEDFDTTVEHYQHLCKITEGTDLLISTENALTADQQLELLDRVACDRMKIYFDTRNPYWMQRYNAAEILEKLYPHVCEIHLKDGIDDGPSCPLGQGNSGFFECMDIMKKNQYNGWYILENDYATAEECKADIATARNCLTSET